MDLELCHVEKVIPINRKLRQAGTKKTKRKLQLSSVSSMIENCLMMVLHSAGLTEGFKIIPTYRRILSQILGSVAKLRCENAFSQTSAFQQQIRIY